MRPPHFRHVTNVFIAIVIAGAATISVCSGEPLTTREKGTLGGGAIGAGRRALVASRSGTRSRAQLLEGLWVQAQEWRLGISLKNSENRHYAQ
jgi:hypothetical protein